MIGWSENLHTLGPPWHMIGHHCITLTEYILKYGIMLHLCCGSLFMSHNYVILASHP